MKNPIYPTFFHGRKYVLAIEWLGSVLFTSASSGEASHKSIKNAYDHTNRQADSAVDQVITAMCLFLHPVSAAVQCAHTTCDTIQQGSIYGIHHEL